MPDAVQLDETCPACGARLLQKSRARLFAAGIALGTLAGLAWWRPWARIPAVILALAAVYLVVWATVARGRWCRTCKRFPLS